MQKNQSKLMQIISWLTPTGIDIVWYLSIAVLLLVVSNADFFRTFLFAPEGFDLRESVLTATDDFLQQFLGENARNIVVIVFWGMVGLIVYIFVWLSMNFSTELGNDLALTKYVHPRGVDMHSPLRDFISKSIFRLSVGLVLIFYTVILVSVLLPLSAGYFEVAVEKFVSLQSVTHGLLGFGVSLMALHFFTVLIRLMTLRKRVFGE